MTQGTKPAVALALLVLVSASNPPPVRPGPAPRAPSGQDARAPAATMSARPAGFDLQSWLDSQHGKEGDAVDWSQILGTAVDMP